MSLPTEAESLRDELERLRQENLELKAALADSTSDPTQLHSVNEKLQEEVREHKQAIAQLTEILESLRQEKDDLEMMLDTVTQHDDAMSDQMQAELDNAVNLANIDGLTQISNRRRFDDFTRQNWAILMAEQQPMSVLLCDIDYFKLYNDHYGHLEGDQCLVQVAQALSKIIRGSKDLAARYGGEEFGVILPKTPLQGAIAVAYRLRAAVNALNIPHEKSKSASHITMSIGVAAMTPVASCSYQDLLESADKQLYKAKIRGRNQISYQGIEDMPMPSS